MKVFGLLGSMTIEVNEIPGEKALQEVKNAFSNKGIEEVQAPAEGASEVCSYYDLVGKSKSTRPVKIRKQLYLWLLENGSDQPESFEEIGDGMVVIPEHWVESAEIFVDDSCGSCGCRCDVSDVISDHTVGCQHCGCVTDTRWGKVYESEVDYDKELARVVAWSFVE